MKQLTDGELTPNFILPICRSYFHTGLGHCSNKLEDSLILFKIAEKARPYRYQLFNNIFLSYDIQFSFRW